MAVGHTNVSADGGQGERHVPSKIEESGFSWISIQRICDMLSADVSGCSGSTSGGSPVSSGGSFTLVNQTSYNCNPSGTMYAIVPGYLPSPTVPISF